METFGSDDNDISGYTAHGYSADNIRETVDASTTATDTSANMEASTNGDNIGTLSKEQIIDKIEQLCNEQFPPGKTYSTKDELKEELEAFGRKWALVNLAVHGNYSALDLVDQELVKVQHWGWA